MDVYAVFQMAPATDGGDRRHGYVAYKGDHAGALAFLKDELGKHPTWQNVFYLVKIVPFHADITVSVIIQAEP